MQAKMASVLHEAGSLISSSEPYAAILSSAFVSSHCACCFQPASKLSHCAACKLIRYCGKCCQKKDWMIHKQECVCFKNVAPKLPLANVRLLLRLIVAGDNKSYQDNSQNKLPRNMQLSDLVSHKSDIKGDLQRTEVFAQVCHTLRMLTINTDLLSERSFQELFEIFCKMCINSFTVTNMFMEPIGCGIFLNESQLDHSCEPNAVVTFDGPVASVFAIRQILTSEPVLISYLDLLSTTDERKHDLLQQYYFDCTCEKCSMLELDSRLLAAMCRQCEDGDVYIHMGEPLSCGACGKEDSSPAFLDEYQHEMQQSKMDILQLSNGKDEPELVRSRCMHIRDRQMKLLANTNICLAKVNEKLLAACIDLELWHETLPHCQALMAPYALCYGKQHPIYGIKLMQRGKIELYIGENLEEALKLLQQSENVLLISHAKSHPLMTQLCELMDQCKEELRVKGVAS